MAVLPVAILAECREIFVDELQIGELNQFTLLQITLQALLIQGNDRSLALEGML